MFVRPLIKSLVRTELDGFMPQLVEIVFIATFGNGFKVVFKLLVSALLTCH